MVSKNALHSMNNFTKKEVIKTFGLDAFVHTEH